MLSNAIMVHYNHRTQATHPPRCLEFLLSIHTKQKTDNGRRPTPKSQSVYFLSLLSSTPNQNQLDVMTSKKFSPLQRIHPVTERRPEKCSHGDYPFAEALHIYDDTSKFHSYFVREPTSINVPLHSVDFCVSFFVLFWRGW